MKIEIPRTTLCVTTYCNLKCKHCLAFIPYYKEHRHLSNSDAKEILKRYFEIVDKVDHFTITGGEPLLNKELLKILNEVIKYSNQINKSIDFVTNGTIKISNEILTFFKENNKKTKIVLSDYGPELSVELKNIEHDLILNGITYRVSHFFGDDLYYNGWIDFTDHSYRWTNKKDRDQNASQCLHRTGKYFLINDGELHSCSRSFWRMREGIIPKIKEEYIPLMDDTLSVAEKKQILLNMYNMKSSTSCAYCVGFRNDVERTYPAQQIK